MKALTNATPEQIRKQLNVLGKSHLKFSEDADPFTSPDAAAKFIFGPGVKGSDMQTVEQCIALIKKHYSSISKPSSSSSLVLFSSSPAAAGFSRTGMGCSRLWAEIAS